MDYTELLTEKPQFLSLIPAITFGYLFYLTTLPIFLILSLYLIIPAGVSIHARERGYEIEVTVSTKLNLVLYSLLGPFIISFIIGPILLLHFSSPSDLISAGLVFVNWGFVIFVYSDRVMEILGTKPDNR